MNTSPTRSISGPTNALLGMCFALAAITMLFMGLTSAYVARRGLDPQWVPISPPSAALPACAFLLASSITLEHGRKTLNFRWLTTTWALAAAFVAAQIAACGQLSAAGLYLSTSPHSSFFYLFTALHGVHVLGGVAGLTWVIASPLAATRINVVALYWHAMTLLWIGLLAVLFTWN
jgi:cytochrome c oxidase subunit III